MSIFKTVANDVSEELEDTYPERDSRFREVASRVERTISLRNHMSADDRDQEWQRVNSYIADVLKDSHVMYSKLIRLQGDFIGSEQKELESISEATLELGERLSAFMKAFHNGDADMKQDSVFGGGGGEGGQQPPVPQVPVPEPPAAPDSEFEEEIQNEEDEDFEGFEEEEEDSAA